MFWRFGFHNASAIDSLLDKEDVSLEAILDEEDLLQECKSQNTRLIDYFQRVDVLQRLFAYVTGQIEGEEKGRFKYPYVATEVLCCEIWSIVETCMNEQTQLLIPFWETVLDRSAEDMKTRTVMASHFAKINAVFLSKKPAEMFAFIRSQPDVVARLLLHVESPSIVDLLVRTIQLDEQPTGAGVLEWLSTENLMGRLIELLSPAHSGDVHTVVAELIKGIISMATPSPGAGLTEGLHNGPASNRFARQLARRESITTLMTYILHDFSPPPNSPDDNKAYDSEPSTNQQISDFESATSSVVHSVSVIVELIRKNNSDYFEPYLFHTLRNRLIQVQQQLHDNSREALEQAMKEMVERMGVVHLGPLLEIMCIHLKTFQHFLRSPRSLAGPISTTVGSITPLTFERYRICELFAELLHCSNMSLLSRSPSMDHLYDSEGRLQGGLSALEALGQVISSNNGNSRDPEITDETNEEMEPALELPISHHHDLSSLYSDDDMSDSEAGSSDDDAMEEIVMFDEPHTQLELSPISIETALPAQHATVPPSPNTPSTPSPSEISAHGAALSRVRPHLDTDRSHPPSTRRSSRRTTTNGDASNSPLPIGDKLKRQFLEIDIASTLLNLFFEFPWNNFLHSAVYDHVHQILTGNVDDSCNRELAIALFRDSRLMHRIVEGQKRNDLEVAKPNGVRLGYMGHLTLMAEDVIMALERFPPDLRLKLIEYAPDPEWDHYVTGRYNETKNRDARLLGGGKPVLSPSSTRSVGRWKVDEDDTIPSNDTASSVAGNETRGEFRRAGGHRLTRESSADFGPAPMQDDMEEEEESNPATPHFARYLAQEMHSGDTFSSSSSDDEDEEGGWLSQSTFTLSAPPVSARHGSAERRPLALCTTGFEDSFNPSGTETARVLADDPFNPHDEDGFGPFADSHASSGDDPFTFPSSSEEMEDSSFDSSFGDFGEFQSAQDGELTPTTGSWTFAGTSDEAGSDSGEIGSPGEEKRVIGNM